MPLAVTHVLTSIIMVDLYRDYISKHKRYFSLHTILIAGIAGLLPDLDVPIRMLAQLVGVAEKIPGLFQHGGITHTPLFGLLFLIPGIIFWNKRKHKKAMYFFVITFGILLHIFLDYFIGGGSHSGVMWFFPFSMQGYKLHLILLIQDKLGVSTIIESVEAILLLVWLIHEEIKHKISDFI